jgi:hypothetical protein
MNFARGGSSPARTRGHIVFDQVPVAFDLTDEVGLVPALIEVTVPNLPIIVRADA